MSEAAAPVLRLKMQVYSVVKVEHNVGEIAEQVSMNAVYDNGKANKQWSKWTPAGSLTMTISNPTAQDRVKQGDYVFVDITPTDKDSL